MIRHPRARQDPGRSTLTYEVRGRIVHDVCLGKGCPSCRYRGWMIDDALLREEFPIPAWTPPTPRTEGAS